MKQYSKLLLVLITGAILFSSCGKSNKQGKLIPKNAAIVFHLNTKSLSEKLSWDEIKKTSWFNKIYTDTARLAWISKILDNPDNSGIDTKTEFIVFLQRTSEENAYVVIEGDVKDTKAFEQFNKNMHANTTSSKDGDINMISINNEGVVGWNDSKFMYIFKAPDMKRGYDFSQFQSDSTFSKPPVLVNSQNLTAACKSLFSLKSDSSLEKDEKFSELMKEEGDIHYWINTEALMSSNPSLGMLSMLKLDMFFKGNVSTATVKFDNGKITSKHRLYLNKDLYDLLKKYGGGNVDEAMVKNIPSPNLDGVFALHFKPEGIRELIKLTGMDGMLNMMISQQGFSLDDFVAANKGDIMFAVTDFSKKPYTSQTDTTNGMVSNHGDFGVNIKFLFSAGIGDKAAFDKLINAGKKISQGMHNDSSVHYAKNDKYFAIGNDQDFVNKYIAGSAGNKFDFLDKFSGHPIGFFVDINKILQGFTGMERDSTSKIMFDKSIALWGNVYSTGGDLSDGSMTSNMELNLIDKNTNSLKQLNAYTDELARIAIEKHKKDEQMIRSDSTAIILPPIDSTATTKTVTKPKPKRRR